MPYSLNKNYVHITFGTRFRRPLIANSIKEELFSYLGGVCKNHECNPVIVGGYKDHIHILCLLSGNIALSNLVLELKTNSSKWMKKQGYKSFYWQNGYGCFSVSPREVGVVESYILNQENHHKKESYQEEYERLLKKCQIDYDPKYLWDS